MKKLFISILAIMLINICFADSICRTHFKKKTGLEQGYIGKSTKSNIRIVFRVNSYDYNANEFAGELNIISEKNDITTENNVVLVCNNDTGSVTIKNGTSKLITVTDGLLNKTEIEPYNMTFSNVVFDSIDTGPIVFTSCFQ